MTRAIFAVALLCACGPPPQQQYANPPPGQYAGGGPPGYAQAPPEPPYHCADLERPGGTRGSLCHATAERCERERSAAEADGLRTTACRPQRPVSCFQLGGDPAPANEMCAGTPADCELWRKIDRDKNGSASGPCDWRHGEPGAPARK